MHLKSPSFIPKTDEYIQAATSMNFAPSVLLFFVFPYMYFTSEASVQFIFAFPTSFPTVSQ